MPKVGGGSAGAHVASPEAHKRITYQTNLAIEILANEYNKPSPTNPAPSSNTNWTLILIVGIILL